MNMKKAAAIIENAVGLTWHEWCVISEMVNRKFAAERNKVILNTIMAESALRALEAEAPAGG